MIINRRKGNKKYLDLYYKTGMQEFLNLYQYGFAYVNNYDRLHQIWKKEEE